MTRAAPIAAGLILLAGCGSSDSADLVKSKPKDAGVDVVDAEPIEDANELPDVEVVDGGSVSDAAPVAPPPGVWTYYSVPGTECLNGAEAGFGIITNPASQDLMIYLEGGGACFNDACDFTAFNVPFIPPPDGIFNRINP